MSSFVEVTWCVARQNIFIVVLSLKGWERTAAERRGDKFMEMIKGR
jgi:hypothetical protein